MNTPFNSIVTWCAHPFCIYLNFNWIKQKTTWNTIPIESIVTAIPLKSLYRFDAIIWKWDDDDGEYDACLFHHWDVEIRPHAGNASNELQRFLFAHSRCRGERDKNDHKNSHKHSQMQLIFCCSSSRHSNKPFMNYDFISVDRLICRWSFACWNRHFSSLLYYCHEWIVCVNLWKKK